jgi:proton glutamate symport protein
MKQGLWVLVALVLGIVVGTIIGGSDQAGLISAAKGVSAIGSAWLDALRMTLLPLIVSILIASIAGMAQSASAGVLARNALIWFAVLTLGAGVYAILATRGLLALWPISPASAKALLQGTGTGPDTLIAPLEFGPWLRSLIPTNVVKSAAEDAILPVVVFACVFGFAVIRLPDDKRLTLVSVFQSIADAMIVIVQWVLAFAPLGVFGLSLALGLNSGLDTLGVMAQYVILVSAVTFGIGLFGLVFGVLTSGLPPLDYLRALLPIQVMAASTQSSLATLPAMLQAAIGPLKVPAPVAEMVLPLAVAVFRLTSPVANLAVVMFLLNLYGIHPSFWQFGAAVVVAFAVAISSVGLPGQTSFFASVAPICIALGVPITLLPVLLAVEVIPDIFRTIGNVTGDLAVTRLLARQMDKGVNDLASAQVVHGQPE